MNLRVARLTPPGSAAIATVAIVGNGAWTAIRDLFRSQINQPLAAEPNAGSLHFGHFGTPPGDEVVLARRQKTKEPWFEIHCHGGTVVVDWIIEQITSRGAQLVSWQELERQTSDSWIRAAAGEALTRAITVKTASILLNQCHGALESEIQSIIALMDSKQLREAQDALGRLLMTAEFGTHLTAPFRVAIFGPPNVGKSSLINRLVGFERAIVSPIAGTTREMTTTITAIEGWPFEFVDSPGVRHSSDTLESEGVRRALAALEDEQFDISIWMIDGSDPATSPPETYDRFATVVVNKVDLPQKQPIPNVASPVFTISALTGAGIEELQSSLVKQVIGEASLEGGELFKLPMVAAALEATMAIRIGNAAKALTILRSLLQSEQPQSPAPESKLE